MKKYVLKNLDQLSETDPIFSVFSEYIEKKLIEKSQVICDQKELDVWFNNHRLNLGTHKKIFKLFQVFAESRSQELSRSDLIRRVYLEEGRQYSPRYLSSLDHNIIKLISRARKLAVKSLGVNNTHLRWFHYDLGAKKWTLVRFNVHVKLS
jgi:hypothetical protein